MSNEISAQDAIDRICQIAYKHYEDARQNSTDETDKEIRLERFYINFLKPVYDILHDKRGVKMIYVERYAQSGDNTGHMYVPGYMNKDGKICMNFSGFKYRGTALMKLIASFSSDAGDNKIV